MDDEELVVEGFEELLEVVGFGGATDDEDDVDTFTMDDDELVVGDF